MHTLVFEPSAVAPVLAASAAGLGKLVPNGPEDYDGNKIVQRVFGLEAAFQAADGNEQGDKKEDESHVFAFFVEANVWQGMGIIGVLNG